LDVLFTTGHENSVTGGGAQQSGLRRRARLLETGALQGLGGSVVVPLKVRGRRRQKRRRNRPVGRRWRRLLRPVQSDSKVRRRLRDSVAQTRQFGRRRVRTRSLSLLQLLLELRPGLAGLRRKRASAVRVPQDVARLLDRLPDLPENRL